MTRHAFDWGVDLPASFLAINPILDRLQRSSKASRTSATAHASGEGWEAWIEAQHAEAVALGLVAWVVKAGRPSEPHISGGKAQYDRRGRLLLAATGDAPPDFLGVLSDGRVLVVEAKRRTGRLSASTAPEHRAGIPEHQQDRLARAARAGGLALLAVEFVRERKSGDVVTRHFVPWQVIPWASGTTSGAARTVGPEELRPWEWKGGNYLAAWVEASRAVT